MILHELKTIQSGRHERHQFGIVIAIALFLVGGFLWWRSGFYPLIFVIGLMVLAPVLIDKILKTDTAIVLLPFQKVWMSIAVVMGTIMSTIFLSLFFYGVFTSVRGLNFFLGKALLDTVWDPGAKESYWIRREQADYDPTQSEKQY